MAYSASLSYASPGTGNFAGGIGWVDFGTFTLGSGETTTGVTATLLDGSTLTFDITNSVVSGQQEIIYSQPTGVFKQSPFGTLGYTGISGNVVLKTLNYTTGTTRVTFSNIKVVDPNGNPVPNYCIYMADGEATGGDFAAEKQVWTTNGGPWSITQIVGTGNSPVLTGVGSTTATLTGVAPLDPPYNSPVLQSLNPTTITADLTVDGTQQAVVFGVSVTKIQVQKIITARKNASDQFTLNIGGTPSSSFTTSGNTTGLQTQTAYVYAPINGTYNLSEAMAAGSSTPLSGYTTTVSYENLTPGGSPVPTGTSLPQSVVLANTDIIVATVTNTPGSAEPIINPVKSVSKTAAIIGDILTYTVSFTNTGTGTANSVVITDPIPAGTTYLTNSVTANVAFTGTPATGIILTNPVAPGNTVKVSFKVIVNSIPAVNPIPNTATVSYQSGTTTKATNTNTVYTIIFNNSRGVAFM